MAFLSAIFTPSYPSTNNQLRSSSNPRNQATIQDGQAKVVKCYNCQGEGHMARQCTHPKRRRDAAWFKEKVLLVQAQAKGKELDEEQLAFLADPGIADGQVAQTITHNAAF
ncbi:retrovirus-related pol polyprotein from transposon TNT 1-94 [Tanacetum coccineum]